MMDFLDDRKAQAMHSETSRLTKVTLVTRENPRSNLYELWELVDWLPPPEGAA